MSRIIKSYMRLFTTAHIGVPLGLALLISGPLFFNDYALMIYQQHKAVQFFGEFHNLWGYDPFYSAGYPLNFIWNSNLDLQFLSVLLQPVPEYIVLLIATLTSIIIAPLVFWAGLGNFGLRGTTRNTAMILMLAYWWSGIMSVFMQIGMPSAMFAFHLSFYTVSLFYKFFQEDDPGILTRLYVFTPLCFIAHKTAMVIVCVPVLILFFCNIRNVNFRRLAHLAGIGALVLAVNSFWLIPFIDLLKFKTSLAEAPHGLCYDPLRIFKDYFTLSKIMGHKVIVADSKNFLIVLPNTVIRDALLAFGVYGIIAWWRQGRRTAAAFFGTFTILFLAGIYFGSFWGPSALLNPTRYIAYLDFMLAVPAAAGLAAIWNRIPDNSQIRRNVTRFIKPALVIFFVMAIIPYIFFFNQTDRRLDADTLSLTSYLKEHTTPNGRIMLEDSGWNDRDSVRDDTPPKYSSSHFPSLLSDLTGREFIGGPYPYVFLSHHYADFHDGRFLTKPLEEFSSCSMRKELNRYHIRWIVCWSEDCKNYFSGSPGTYKHLESIGKFEVFERIRFENNPFISGDGYIIADHRGIRCYRVKPENGKAVLKYHSLDKFVIPGGGEAGTTGKESGGDPIGFIKVKDPKAYFTIINSYKK